MSSVPYATRARWPRLLAFVAIACVAAVAAGAPAPARIVSTSPSITETLFALGLGPNVVGVSSYCRFPPAVASIPKVGTFLKPNAELIARLRPDLVVLHSAADGAASQMKSLHLPFVTVEPAEDLDGVYLSIRVIGRAAGIPDRADTLVADLRARLDRVHHAVASAPKKKVLVIVGRRAGTLSDLVAVGTHSYLSDIVTIAGGGNVLAGLGPTDYPRISMETVIRLAPDVIIDAGDMGDTPAEHETRRAATEALWATQSLVAAGRSGVHAVVSDAFVIPGPRVVEAAETMAEWLHGVTVR